MESAGAGGCRQHQGRAGRCFHVCFTAGGKIRFGCEADRAGKNGEKRAQVSGRKIERQSKKVHRVVTVNA